MYNNETYYIARFEEETWKPYEDIEEKYDGHLQVSSVSGVRAKGKIKNIYTESYAETSNTRVYLPTAIARENTTIKMVIAFDKMDAYENFVSWISGYRLKYVDKVRNREVEMIMIDEPAEQEAYEKGSHPFFVMEFTFKNLTGDSKIHIIN